MSQFYKLHKSIRKETELDLIDRVILAIVISFYNDGKEFTGKVKFLREETGKSEATIRRSLKTLIDDGFITKNGKYHNPILLPSKKTLEIITFDHVKMKKNRDKFGGNLDFSDVKIWT